MAFVLIGFMGAGKSTIAPRLAKALGGACADSDVLLAERFGHSVADEFARAGEAAFRAQEEEVVCELLAGAGAADVLALGGGSVLSERVGEALAPHRVALLDVDVRTAWARVRSRGQERPLAREYDAFAALHAERAPLYERRADAWLPAQGVHDVSALARALRALAAAPQETRLVWARAQTGEYPVYVGRGLLAPESLAALWPLDRDASRAFCVCDRNVAPLYAERIGGLAELIEIEPGEPSKTLASAELVWSALAAGGMTRADHLVALGGGVVGDLAGFCAATYQRGVPVVHVPTTLVAQVDSAYGGKTGVDLPAAKNYVGSYHQPRAVIVDPDALASLPAHELAAGYVEVIKTALIAGGELWRRVAAEEPLDERTILACARAKLAVVAKDERDAGARQALNLGHTVGHALEAVTGYERYRHGEAVGLGLLVALRLSGREQERERVRELLTTRGLPVRLEDEDVDQVIAATARDKKRLGEHVPFVLLEEPGKPRIGCRVQEAQLRAAIEELAP